MRITSILAIAAGATAQIEVVRGRMDEALASELLAFWDREAGFSGEPARRRLGEVICVVRRDGVLSGASSAFAAEAPAVGGRRFWVYRSLLGAGLEDMAPAMIRASFGALQAEFDGRPEAPIGLCVMLDAAERRRRPLADWLDPRLIYAGYAADGRQLRIGYFEDALIAPRAGRPGVNWRLEPGLRIERFADQDTITAADVLELWSGEGALPAEEARRRVGEVLLVASDAHGELAGVATTYLARHPQLRADMWHFRTFIAPAHRLSGLAIALTAIARDHHMRRYEQGEDRRAIGVVLEVENEGFKRHFPEAHWFFVDFTFVGLTPLGAHVYVLYFPSAPAPEPDGSLP